MDDVVRDLLPEHYNYKLIKYEVGKLQEDIINFKAEIRVDINSEENFKIALR